jgi:iron complex transport system substrate-binding protein
MQFSVTRLLVLLLLLGSGHSAMAWAVTDDRGVTLHFAQVPRRIVSLLPSLTESVCVLGHCASLVGVDSYSNWPPSLARVPRVGGLDDVPVEAIVALRPDVVLLAGSARVRSRLEALGIPVLALEPKTLLDARRVLRTLGVLLQTGAAERVWADIEAALAVAVATVPAGAHGSRVYFEVSREPFAASESSFIGEVLAQLGFRNIVPGNMGPFPLLNPEYVVRSDPDLILVGDASVGQLAQRPGWAGLRALRSQRVCAFRPEQSDVLVRPGPRLAQAAQLIAQCVRDKWSN